MKGGRMAGLMFYGGLLGMVLSTILGIIFWINFVLAKKRLIKKLNEEYGIF